MNRGKLVIVTILGVALLAAGFSTWYHYRGQHRALDFWGTNTAVLIVEAPQAKVFQIGDSSPDSSSDDGDASDEAITQPEGVDAEQQPPAAVEFGGLAWKVLATKEALGARGINNVRRALVLDTTYDWQGPPAADEPHWHYALAVNDGRHWATLLFDFQSRRVALAGGKKTALLDPAANDDLRQFFAEQFSDEPRDKPAAQPADESADKPAGEPAEKQ